ncbi:MAG: universal stress protein [Deltaproteobacteria bacterium]|nr:universal stress protein [Deltaproteobacteria bacterium]
MACAFNASKNLVWSIPISMTIGLLVGYGFDAGPLKKLIIPITFIMVYPMMVTLNVKTIFKGQDYKLQIATQIINFVLVPLLAFYTGRLFFAGGPEKYGLWAVGLFLIGVLPTSGMTISWTGFARGNKEAAIKKVGQQTWNDRVKPKFPPFSALGVILIAFVAMSLKAKSIIANPTDILTIMVPLAVFYLVTYGLLTVAGRLFFNREDAPKAPLPLTKIKPSVGMATVTALPTRLTAPGEPMLPSIQKVLYATDLSDTARHAIRYACILGNSFGASVTLLHVIPDLLEALSRKAGIDLADHMGKEAWADFHINGIEKAKDTIYQQIKETSRRLTKEIFHCPLTEENVMVKVGNPVRQIVATAKDGPFDLIIMGTHGHGKMEAHIIGSTAGDVIRLSDVPVMVVRLPKEKESKPAAKRVRSHHPATRFDSAGYTENIPHNERKPS